MSPAPGSVEDVGKRPKKPKNALERIREQSERREGEELTQGAQTNADEPGSETTAPGDAHTYQEGPIGDTNERVNGTNAPSRDTGPGGRLEVQEESKDVEGNPDSANVVDSAVYDGKRPKSIRTERDVDTNALCRVRGPGGHLGEEVGSGDVDDDQEHQSHGNGDEMDGIPHRMDDTMSGASGESKRLDTRSPTRVSTNGANAKRRTYLIHPDHLPSNIDDPRTIRTHRVDTDASKRDLDKSVRPDREDHSPL